MFQDEARFGHTSNVQHCHYKKPHCPMVYTMLTQQYSYAYSATSPLDYVEIDLFNKLKAPLAYNLLCFL